MKILAVSDIHCSFHYSSVIALEAVKNNCDLILIAGDIECTDPLEEFIATGIRVFGVTGNLDDPYIYRFMKERNIAIDGNVTYYSSVRIIGLGGLSLKSNIERVKKTLEQDKEEKKTIVLSHYPAYGFNDVVYSGYHAGLHELKEFIEEYKPVLFIHGHIHEARGVAKYHNTVIVNPGPAMHGYYAIIDLNEEIKVDLRQV
ncbi:MAG: hypothetical protein DRO40_01125 [Thermoprotei archaeon]|nr:MAG: hypothetical protein DRO40_01125 [Thermoprotei archaeon]